MPKYRKPYHRLNIIMRKSIVDPKEGIPTTSVNRLPVGPHQQFDLQDPAEVRLVASIQQELPVQAAEIVEATRKDPILQQAYRCVLSGWSAHNLEQLQSYYRIRNDLSTSYGYLSRGLRTIVLSCFKARLLKHLHSTHSGMERMKAEAHRYFWWPSLEKEIQSMVNQCQSCTENSKQPLKAPLQ